MSEFYRVGQTVYINLVFMGLKSVSGVDATTNQLTITSHGLSVNDPVTLASVGGILPAPLLERVDYYVKQVVDADHVILSETPGGTEVNLTHVGAGLIYLYGPTNPTALSLQVLRPGVVDADVYAIGDVTNDRTGFYHKAVVPASGEEGEWKWYVSSTGAVAASTSGKFTVAGDDI
jgi:hypothetical protein